MLTVAHVIDNLQPAGTERQVLELVRGLQGSGVRNTVCYFAPGPLLSEFEMTGATMGLLPVGPFASPRFPLRLSQLAAMLRRLDVDVVQTYGFYSNLPGLLAAWLARVRVRIAGRRDLGDQRSTAQRRVDRSAYRLADRVVVNSEAARRRLVDGEGVPARKVVVIRNGLDVGAWSNVTDIGDAEPIVGMVAHFRSEKDHATFLRAAERIRAVMPSVRFCLVGGGPLESSIRTYAANLGLHAAVTFAGPLTGDALRATVKQFAVSVLTSRHESLSNAVLESMMAGVPVVATAVGGTVELVDDGVSGFLVRPGAADAIAERVLILLKDPMAARAMGARGRAKVEQTFTIGRMVADFQALYRELLESRR